MHFRAGIFGQAFTFQFFQGYPVVGFKSSHVLLGPRKAFLQVYPPKGRTNLENFGLFFLW